MYAIVDIETTGGHASANGITEIAIFVHDGIKVTRHFETLINPGQDIPRYITALTGISNSMVAGAPAFHEVAAILYELLENNIFIAHNVNFDYSFIKHHLKATGYELTAHKLCTVRLGRKIFPGLPSYSLGNLCRSLNIDIENRHRAGGDAKATVNLFEHYLAKGATAHIGQMLKKNSAEQWLPLNLQKNDIASLPTCAGVYYFHNNKDKVVYVGKAINIKKRVSSHFTHYSAESKRQHFLRHIHRISYKICANELEAIVFESTEIRRLWPKYNLSQKEPAQRYGLYLYEDGRGYLRLGIDKKKAHLQPLYAFNLLKEGLALLKKMAIEFNLNEKLCFIDKTPFDASDILITDPPTQYNCRVRTALEALSQQLPTFAVMDEGVKKDEKLYLLIERGSFWGMGYLPASLTIRSSFELKEHLSPYADNDYIRNNIYSFVEANPDKKLIFQ